MDAQIRGDFHTRTNSYDLDFLGMHKLKRQVQVDNLVGFCLGLLSSKTSHLLLGKVFQQLNEQHSVLQISKQVLHFPVMLSRLKSIIDPVCEGCNLQT